MGNEEIEGAAMTNEKILKKALEEILEVMPPKVSLPLVVQIKEIAEKAIAEVDRIDALHEQ